MKTFKNTMRALFATSLLAIVGCSKSSDEVIEPVTPTTASVPSHTFENVKQTISFSYFQNNPQGIKILNTTINDNATVGIDYIYGTQNKVRDISILDITTNILKRKIMLYDTSTFIKLIKVTTTAEQISGNTATVIEKTEETFGYSGAIVNVTKKVFNAATNAVTSTETFALTTVSLGADNNSPLIITSIDNNLGTLENIDYDGKFNVYKNIMSIKELALVYWENQKITQMNILRKTKFVNNAVTDTKQYTLTYFDNNLNANICTERKLGNVILDKYTY